MNNLIEYLNSTLGVETPVIPLGKQLFKQLPLYITSAYQVREIVLYGHRICLLIAENQEDTLTPDRLSKQMLFAGQKTGLPVVFVFDKVPSYNLKRLIRKGVNFIIPNKQMFIPALMMDLRKMPVATPPKKKLLLPVAQFVLLYHLQKEPLSGFTTRQLSNKLNQTYRTMSRAVKNMEELGLCKLAGGKEKQIQFPAKGKELWMQVRNFFQPPLERIVFTDEILMEKQVCASNINALAHYSMLNDEVRKYYAVDKNEAKNISVETNKYWGENSIEIWRYNPVPLSNNGFVDRLSLFLLLKDDGDERIQNELEQLINKMKWLEE
jgi:DNA-binding MarR family transcriptional regulator